MSSGADALRISRGCWTDRPGYTGIAIRPDGVLAVMVRGEGLIVELSAEQMAALGSRISAAADSMAAREDAAGAQVLAELEALTNDPG